MEKKFNLLELSCLMDFDLIREKIREILKKKRWSISKAEKLSGIGSTVLRFFLLGKTQHPKLETLSLFSKAVGIELSELIEIPNKDLEEKLLLPWKGELFCELCVTLSNLMKNKQIVIPNFQALPILTDIYYAIAGEENTLTNKDLIKLFLKKHFKELE